MEVTEQYRGHFENEKRGLYDKSAKMSEIQSVNAYTLVQNFQNFSMLISVILSARAF